MEYTKGEWEVTKWASHPNIHVSVEDGKGFRFIANCGNPKDDTLPTNPDAEANAHLIAAAPDMYEALKELIDHMTMTKGAFARPTLADVKRMADKALAKAEGK